MTSVAEKERKKGDRWRKKNEGKRKREKEKERIGEMKKNGRQTEKDKEN